MENWLQCLLPFYISLSLALCSYFFSLFVREGMFSTWDEKNSSHSLTLVPFVVLSSINIHTYIWKKNFVCLLRAMERNERKGKYDHITNNSAPQVRKSDSQFVADIRTFQNILYKTLSSNWFDVEVFFRASVLYRKVIYIWVSDYYFSHPYCLASVVMKKKGDQHTRSMITYCPLITIF